VRARARVLKRPSAQVYGWEGAVAQRVAAARGAERASIFKSQSMKALNLSVYFVSPALASLATFSSYWAQVGQLPCQLPRRYAPQSCAP
jgi:hypothetical protein